MAEILVTSTEIVRLNHWIDTLERQHSVTIFCRKDKKIPLSKFDLIIVDYKLFEIEKTWFLFENLNKLLVTGSSVSYQKQVQFIVEGACGYSEQDIDRVLINKAVDSVLNDEMWLGRQLVPYIINNLIENNKLRTDSKAQLLSRISDQRLSCLTKRELDVAESVYAGETFAEIANQLCVTERTVKSHLSSILNKLNVKDRFELVVLLKNIHLDSLFITTRSPNSLSQGKSF